MQTSQKNPYLKDFKEPNLDLTIIAFMVIPNSYYPAYV